MGQHVLQQSTLSNFESLWRGFRTNKSQNLITFFLSFFDVDGYDKRARQAKTVMEMMSAYYTTALQLYQLQVQQFNNTHPSDPWTEKAQASIILFKVSVS